MSLTDEDLNPRMWEKSDSQPWNFYSPSALSWPWDMMGLDNLISSVGLDPPPGHKQPLTLTTAFPVSAELAEPLGLVGIPHAGVFLKQSGK